MNSILYLMYDLSQPWCRISFDTFFEHEQLNTAGVQYIVSGSWKNKLFSMPSRERKIAQNCGVLDILLWNSYAFS